MFLTVFQAIDIVPRAFVAKVSPREPSGEIVLVDMDGAPKLSRGTAASRLARGVRYASSAGAEATLVEGSFSETDPDIAQLRDEIVASKSSVTIGWPVAFQAEQDNDTRRVDRKAAFPNAHEALDLHWAVVFDFIADEGLSWEISGRPWLPFSSAIAGVDLAKGSYPINYRYPIEGFTHYRLSQLDADPELRRRLAGKRVVLASTVGNFDNTATTPIDNRVPRIYINILAAETLRAGPPTSIPWYYLVLPTLFLLVAGLVLGKQIRWRIYAAALIAAILLPFVLSFNDIYLDWGRAILMLTIFLALRTRVYWRESAAGIEHLSGLSNFHALEDNYQGASGRLVVAQVENYEEMLASLEPEYHPELINLMAQRLSIGGSSQIYTDTTGHFAWFDELEHAKSHVAGLLALTSAPIVIGRRTLDFSCSFGLLDCPIAKPRQAISATVVAAANAARRSTHIAYVSEQEGHDADWQLSLLASMDQAISKEQIYLAFQPQRNLLNGRIVGVEALVRWRHPERGVISPSQFIPQIESAGRLKPLTAHTLRLAARASEATMQSNVRVSVNISATLISNDDFVTFIHENILAGGGRPNGIIIEITETARIADLDRAAKSLADLRKLGYEVALDDFGTGEANLSLLVSLPCDELKIDRSFVVLSQHSERARMVISALARTARLSGMRLVAEGIETEEDHDVLRELGCEVGQGYLLGKPQLFVQFLSQLEAEREDPRSNLRLY